LGAFFRILIFLILSGVIAYVGDYVGHKAGKMRITIFGFRPRKTSRVIAVGTGVLITIITLSLLLIFSREAKIALLDLDKITNEIRDLESKKTQLEEDVYNLEEDKKKLEERINTIANRVSLYPMVFEAYQPLSYILIKKKTPPEEIKKNLDRMKEKASKDLYQKNQELFNIVKSRGVEVPKDLNLKGNVLTVIPPDFINYLASIDTDQVVCMYSVLNIFLGDDLCAGFTIQDNKMIFSKGKTIVEGTIDSNLSRKNIWEFMVKLLLNDLREKALASGMIPDPAKGLGVDIPMPEIWQLCDEIMTYSGKIRVQIIAKENIWTLGPLKFEIKKDLVKQ